MTKARDLSQVPNASLGFKNRLINSDMRIDQRNAGASVSTTPTDAVYTLDRWLAAFNVATRYTVQQNAGSVTPPAGFANYLGVTSTAATSVGSSDYYFLQQIIEGFNVADLGWGTANAQTVTLSFWVRSSLTGTFGGSLTNSAQNRSYPLSYTISAANTWEQKTITIAGDTTGTWLTTNGAGIRLRFGLGVGSTNSGTAGSWSASNFFSATGATSVVGTSGATFYITGVQLEKGSTATSFDYRPYGTELALCQRYYYRIKSNSSGSQFGSGFNFSGTVAIGYIPFPVTMRVAPTLLEQSGTASDYGIYRAGDSVACTTVPQFNTTDQWCSTVAFTTTNGITAGQGTIVRALNTANGFLGFPAEL